MSINQELSVLYDNWRKQHPGHFVAGGIIDEERYESADVKVLFLLKEVNDSEQSEDWSLIDFIQDQIGSMSFYRTMEILGLWSFGLQQGLPPYQTLQHMKEENIAEGLLDIAITNLKKSGGGGESNYEEIRDHASLSKELWIKEIEKIQPDVVICCGTFPFVHEVLGFPTKVCDSGAVIGEALGIRFVDFVHPMYRVSPKLVYAYFKETMRALGY